MKMQFKLLAGLIFCSATLFAHDAPPSDAKAVLEETKFMTKGQYITGGVIGTIFGFGIGHGIQGRYTDIGWVFTLTDLVGIGLITGGEIIGQNAGGDQFRNGNYSEKAKISAGGFAMETAGALILLGFRIWEIVDLWATPSTRGLVYNEVQATKGKLAFVPVLAPTHLGFSLSY